MNHLVSNINKEVIQHKNVSITAKTITLELSQKEVEDQEVIFSGYLIEP